MCKEKLEQEERLELRAILRRWRRVRWERRCYLILYILSVVTLVTATTALIVFICKEL